MSHWTDFRNAVETILQPGLARSINFMQTIEDLAKQNGVQDLEQAAIAGYTASLIQGTVEQKLIAALEAFSSSAIGEAVQIVKTAVAAPTPIPAPSPSPAAQPPAV